jgi:cbb3-type cytochrome oxidase subunit 1
MLVMFLDLMFAGIFQGFSWASLAPWDDSVTISLPFWWVRIVAGLGIIAGQVCFFVNLYKTCQAAQRKKTTSQEYAAGGEHV